MGKLIISINRATFKCKNVAWWTERQNWKLRSLHLKASSHKLHRLTTLIQEDLQSVLQYIAYWNVGVAPIIAWRGVRRRWHEKVEYEIWSHFILPGPIRFPYRSKLLIFHLKLSLSNLFITVWSISISHHFSYSVAVKSTVYIVGNSRNAILGN